MGVQRGAFAGNMHRRQIGLRPTRLGTVSQHWIADVCLGKEGCVGLRKASANAKGERAASLQTGRPGRGMCCITVERATLDKRVCMLNSSAALPSGLLLKLMTNTRGTTHGYSSTHRQSALRSTLRPLALGPASRSRGRRLLVSQLTTSPNLLPAPRLPSMFTRAWRHMLRGYFTSQGSAWVSFMGQLGSGVTGCVSWSSGWEQC